MTHTITLRQPQHAREVMRKLWDWMNPRLQSGRSVTLTVAEDQRTSEQNRMMWAALTDVSKQVIWHGAKLTPEEWKHVFSAALWNQRTVPGIDGGFVVLGQSTSRMSVAQMTEMIDLVHAFGAQRGVEFGDNDELTGRPLGGGN
jgi:hypothetical protein